jgi:hypothetical protein
MAGMEDDRGRGGGDHSGGSYHPAIEAAVDRDSVRIDALGKRAKDYGSAAAMIALFAAGITWSPFSDRTTSERLPHCRKIPRFCG